MVDVIRYLVIKALANKFQQVVILKEYFVDGFSPSDLSARYCIRKDVIRGYITRIHEQIKNKLVIKPLLENVYPLLEKISPVIENVCRCKLCGEVMHCNVVEYHIRYHHRDVVDEYVDSIVEILKKRINEVKGVGGSQ